MSPDTITIVIAIIGTGIALGVLIVPSLRDLRRDITGLHRDVGDLRERMARIEGSFEGFTRRKSHGAQRAGQRIEVVRLAARHDVEGRSHRAVCDRRQSTDQHAGDPVPVRETGQGLGIERRRVGVAYREAGQRVQ